MPTILKTKNSVTTTVTPTSLAQGELAVNITDKKMWVGNAATTPVQILGAGATNRAGGSNTQVQYNSSGDLAGSANMTFSGTTLTLANDASISGLNVGKGGGAVGTNTAYGLQALNGNTTGLNNTGIGYLALGSNSTGSYLVAVGQNALGSNTTATRSVAVGWNAAGLNTTGEYQAAFGFNALNSNTTGGLNTAIGSFALNSNTTASNNTAVGYQAGYSNTTGANNISIGYQASHLNTTASSQVAIGFQALYTNTTGAFNTAIGHQTLYTNTGQYNTAVGDRTLYSNTTGGQNTGVGQGNLYTNTTGSNNVAFGWNGLLSNTTGGSNTALGTQSLYSNTTASNNTAVGYQAGYSNTTGTYLTTLGWKAGYTSTGDYNTFLGAYSGQASTGVQNTFIGQGSGDSMTTGGKNTIVGRYNGNNGGLDIRTASNYIVLSDGDGNPRAFIDNTGTLLIGTNGNTGSNNKLVIDSSAANWNVISRTLVTSGNSYCGMLASFGAYSPNNTSSFFFQGSDTTTQRFQVYSNGGIANYQANNVNLSDETLKKDIQLSPNYLDKLCQIPVKTYLYKDQTDIDLNLGVIAQDVKAICPELVGTMDIGEIDSPNIKLAIYETDLKYAMLKAIQELKAEVDSLKQQLGK